MKLIGNPQSVAERVVNAIVAEIYGRSGGDHWFDGIDEETLKDDLIPSLVTAVIRELDPSALPEPPR